MKNRTIYTSSCGTQAPKSELNCYHNICWWRSAACWASSTIIASSKNLLMLTSSLIPCQIQCQLQHYYSLDAGFLVIHYCANCMFNKIIIVLYPQTNLYDFEASTSRSFSDCAANAATTRLQKITSLDVHYGMS